jgi:hypothetical protein
VHPARAASWYTRIRGGALRPVRILRRFEARAFHENWFIAVRRETSGAVPPIDMDGFAIIAAPRDHFYADPFLVEWDGRVYLFVEDFSFTTGRGEISYFELHADGSVSGPTPALAGPHHLSYPFVFEHEGSLYLLPEKADSGRLEIFRADHFPGPFAAHGVLMDGVKAVDPTLHHHGGLFWLFANAFEDGGNPHDTLNLFSAASPFGPWTPHPANPVVQDRRAARPAGAIQARDGRLVRPAQDCGERYGAAVVFREIVRLDPEHYDEREIGRIAPGWLADNLGTHTYNRGGGYEVVDGRWYSSERAWLDFLVRAASRIIDGPGVSEIRRPRGPRSWR